MTAIGEALARASEDDAESLEALCRALLRGGHGPEVSRVLSLVEGEIELREHAALALQELQRRQREDVREYGRRALEWEHDRQKQKNIVDAQHKADERTEMIRSAIRRRIGST